ncbi:MAG: aldolase catalytic domain-containing protein [Treponema sp.]|nr:aldolase catalytic domain-containing protein [Treponema sp.]
MRKLYLLDCTLRDGGYVNDWEFGAGSIKSIFSRLDCAGVDSIEVGFLDDRRTYDPNRSIYPDTASVEPVFENMPKPHALVCAMIDYGTCKIENLAPASESHIDAIRVIFKKHLQDKALDFIKQVKEKGYKVFVNPVSVTTFSDEEMISLAKKINEIEPYAVTIVDTYGLMHAEKLLHYCDVLDSSLNKNIILGYHAHNNFQLAYSNTIAVMEHVKDRNLSIDGTLFGMGKSAGNACTELVAMYMNERFGKNYDINQLQEAIDVDITKEFSKKEWGYRPLFYISALNECHPNYVTQLLDKKTLSVKQINEILSRLPKKDDKNLLYDKELCENLYQDYQNVKIDDSVAVASLKEKFAGKEILLIGPGKSISEQKSKIDDFISQKNPIVISVNFLHNYFKIDYVFMGNAKRYSQFFSRIYAENPEVKLICTSNICEATEHIDYTVNFASLVCKENPSIYDNPLVLLLNLLVRLGIVKVSLAGFDGYDGEIASNYYLEYAPLLYDTRNVASRNEAIRAFLKSISSEIKVDFLTHSRYED